MAEGSNEDAASVDDPASVAGDMILAGAGGGHGTDWVKWLARLARVLSRSARTAGVRGVAGGRWLAGVLVDTAPRLPIRTRAALRAQYPGRSDEEIAEEIVIAASRTTAAIGAAAGALSAVEFAAPPTLLAAPIQIAAETVAVAAAEVKLLAELHELYGIVVPGDPAERTMAYLSGWAQQRAVTRGMDGPPSALRAAAAREVRSRLMRRVGRNLTSLAPFLAGAVAGAEVNRRATRALGTKLVVDLRALRRG